MMLEQTMREVAMEVGGQWRYPVCSKVAVRIFHSYLRCGGGKK